MTSDKSKPESQTTKGDIMLKLPSPDTLRWVKKRKFAVVLAILNGSLSREEAMKRYQLSQDELDSWIRLASSFGVNGLRATRVQEYRSEMVAA